MAQDLTESKALSFIALTAASYAAFFLSWSNAITSEGHLSLALGALDDIGAGVGVAVGREASSGTPSGSGGGTSTSVTVYLMMQCTCVEECQCQSVL